MDNYPEEARVRISAHLGTALEELGGVSGELDELLEVLREQERNNEADEVRDAKNQITRLLREVESLRSRVAEWF